MRLIVSLCWQVEVTVPEEKAPGEAFTVDVDHVAYDVDPAPRIPPD